MTSLAWSFSSICVKVAAEKADSLGINTLRTAVGASLLILFVAFTGRYQAFSNASGFSLGCVVLSGLSAMVIGDTLYIKSMSFLDVSLAFPLSQVSFILLAVLAAALFLGEPMTGYTLLGAGLVVSGVYLMTSSRGAAVKPGRRKDIHPKGLLYLLIAVTAWTLATLLLKIGVVRLDPFVAACVRISTSALILLMLFSFRGKKKTPSLAQWGKKYVLLVILAGFLTYGVAAVGYITAIQWIGAGKTVILTASAPIFALPLAVFILKERPTRLNMLGVLISVVGVWLVVI
jgi:drug/metabolite transporter (DMT)-like permease